MITYFLDNILSWARFMITHQASPMSMHAQLLFWLRTLLKQAYSNILKILPPKTENFQIKILILFHISAQNIDCGYSLEPPRYSQFLSRNKKNNVYPCEPQFYYIKVGFKGVNII